MGRYIAIEGNIGAGKSTLARLLGNYLGSPVILEEFAENPFLALFYEDAARYALPLELSFLADRYKQLTRQLAKQKDIPMIISDYVFAKSKLFAGINLHGAEYDLFLSYFDIINVGIPDPDVLILLDAPVDILLNNIKKRGRSYEQGISANYLEKVADIYHNYIATTALKVIVVDRTAVDFLGSPMHLRSLVAFINTCKDAGIHRFYS